MKVFSIDLIQCNECPNIRYMHFDGEGESCSYQYNHPYCGAVFVNDWPPIPNTTGKILTKRHGTVAIPDWCPLDDK